MKQNWKETHSNVKVFINKDEPEIMYFIKLADYKYLIVHHDAYELNTGKTEILDRNDIIEKYGLKL